MKKPTLATYVIVVLACLCIGAATINSIKWYTDVPQVTTLSDADVISIQQTGPNSFKYITKADFRTVFGGTTNYSVSTNFVLYSSNYYAGDTNIQQFFEQTIYTNYNYSNWFNTYVYQTNSEATNVSIYTFMSSEPVISNWVTTQIYANSYESNYFSTNIFPTTIEYHTNTIGGAYIANFEGMGTNTTLLGSVWLSANGGNPTLQIHDLAGSVIAGWNGAFWYGNGWGLTNLQFAQSNYFETIVNSNITTTNLTVQFITNVTQITTKNLNVTSNIFYLAATPQDIPWAGPTNTVNFTAGSLQYYATVTPCSITNVTGATNGYGNTVLLCITNAASTNVDIWVPTNLYKLGWGESNPLVLTNADILELWFQEASGRRTLTTRGFH